MKELKCQNCGGTQFTPAKLGNQPILLCAHCFTQYTEEPVKIQNMNELPNSSLGGISQDLGAFIVYDTLHVGGISNRITLSDTPPKKATTVRNLTITGNSNTATVYLMPCATMKVSGNSNVVK